MGIEIPETSVENVTMRMGDDEHTILFEGEISSLYPSEYLLPFLKDVFAQAENDEYIVLDVRGLSFLNSSGIGCFLAVIKERKKSMKVIVRTDPSKQWQRTSVNVFRLIDPGNVIIE